jgi:hypothetical protein
MTVGPSTSPPSISALVALCSQGCLACDAPAGKAMMMPRKQDLKRRWLIDPDAYGDSVDQFVNSKAMRATCVVGHSVEPYYHLEDLSPFPLYRNHSFSLLLYYAVVPALL